MDEEKFAVDIAMNLDGRASFPVDIVDFLFTQSNQIILGFTMFYAGMIRIHELGISMSWAFCSRNWRCEPTRVPFPRETLRPIYVYIYIYLFLYIPTQYWPNVGLSQHDSQYVSICRISSIYLHILHTTHIYNIYYV